MRVGGWQPNAEGGYSVYSRTDQILAGLEAAVDPNDDGDVHDAARIALIGMVEPYAAFADGPLPRAIAGAADLDMLTIVPAGNDGRAGPGYGSIAGPGGAVDAVTVGAADGRLAAPTVRVLVRAGLRVLYEDDVPLGGAPSRHGDRRRRPRGPANGRKGDRRALLREGMSDVAGHAVLLPRAALSEDTVDEATSAGALAVLVDGPLPAGAFSLDVPPGVPVVGLAEGVVAEVRALLAEGIPVTVSRRATSTSPRGSGAGSVAAFSSRGLAFDGEPEARPRRAGSLGAHLGAGPRRRRRGSFRDDQRDERRGGGDRRSRSGARAGEAGARRARRSTACSSDPLSASTSTRPRRARASSISAPPCSRSSTPSRRRSRSARHARSSSIRAA